MGCGCWQNYLSYPTPATPASGLRRGISVLLAFCLALAGMVALAPTASAATGINSSVLLNGATYQGTEVVKAGRPGHHRSER